MKLKKNIEIFFIQTNDLLDCFYKILGSQNKRTKERLGYTQKASQWQTLVVTPCY